MTINARFGRFVCAAVAVAATLVAPPSVSGQNEKQSFTGFAINMNSAPRTAVIDFTIIEIRLNANDEGEGKILAGTKIFVDKNKHLVLENYGQQPVRFNEIRKQR